MGSAAAGIPRNFRLFPPALLASRLLYQEGMELHEGAEAPGLHEVEALRRENEDLRRRLESRKLVERAKGLLIQKLGLSEPEAYRRIQKTAMDTRRPMADVAQALLLSEELSQPRPTK